MRRQAAQIGQSEIVQRGYRAGRDRDVRRRRELPRGDRADENPGQKREVPSTELLPVVAEELDAAGSERGAQVTEVGRDPERLVSDEQQGRHDEADEWSGDVPGQRVREQL